MKNLISSISRDTIKSDLSSGIVVFLVAIPLCLGIALASEAPMMSGIIAGIIGGIVIGAFGGSALGVSGPAAGLVAVMVAAQTTLGSFEAVLMATVIAGGMQLLLGVLRAGLVAYYFPTAVIKGMLAAIGVIIIIKQIPHALGDDLDFDLGFVQPGGNDTFGELKHVLSQIKVSAVVITLLGLGILILWSLPALKKFGFFKIIPGPLVVVIMGILTHIGFQQFAPELALSKDHLVNIPTDSGPAEWLMLPSFASISNPQVWLTGLIIASVASVETLLCAEATDKLDPDRRITDMNKELRAQGIGNLASGLIGGLPITQVIVRSSANIQSGGKTRMSAIIHGFLILIAVLLLPSVLNMIPLASLAAILFMVGFKLAHPNLFKKMFKLGWSQFIPFIVTIIAILFTNLLAGIGIGMAVGIVFILYRNISIPYTFETKEENGEKEIRIKLAEIVSFLNKGNIITTLRMIPDNSHVVIDARRSTYIDPDVIDALEDFKENASHRNISYDFLDVNETTEQPSPANPVKELRKVLGPNEVA